MTQNDVTRRPWAGLAQLRGLAWLVVAAFALGLSWWSLFDLAQSFHIPTVLAAGVSLVFDAAALICGNLSHRYATSPDSGAGPRLVMLLLVAGSVFLNWNHAETIMPGNLAAKIMFAAPAVVAVMLFELETAWTNRNQRRNAGRVAPKLPVLGRWSWVFHPVKSMKTVKAVTAAQTDSIRNAELAKWNAAPVTATASVTPVTPAVSPATQTAVTAGPAGDTAPLQIETPAPVQSVTPPVKAPQSVTPVASVTPQPEVPSETRAERTGPLAVLDDAQTLAVLESAGSDAEKIRIAMNAVGPNATDIYDYLSAYGQEIKKTNIRTTLSRQRQRQGDTGVVVPFRNTGTE